MDGKDLIENERKNTRRKRMYNRENKERRIDKLGIETITQIIKNAKIRMRNIK